jgi:hypothetical protein
MNQRPTDLLTLIAAARQGVPDDRYIWCSASETFDSRVVQRRGLLLGGAISPHFLRDASAMSWDIPWAVRLRHCRMLICDKAAAHEPVTEWLPLMESIAGAGEALLVVTETIGSELLSTFIVNATKGTLPVCVVHPGRDRSGNRGSVTPPATLRAARDELLRIDEVWIRRTATACFPNATDSLSSAGVLQNFTIIETGGENHEDQFDRLRFLMRELQQSRVE